MSSKCYKMIFTLIILLLSLLEGIKGKQSPKVNLKEVTKLENSIKAKERSSNRKLADENYLILKFGESYQTDTCWYFHIKEKISYVTVNEQRIDNFENSFDIEAGNIVKIYFQESLDNLEYFLSYGDNEGDCQRNYDFRNKIISMDFSHFDMSQVTSMSYMFYEGTEESKIESIDFSKIITSELIDMSCMFYDCKELISIDLSAFDTSKVTTMSSMFAGCAKLESIDLSNFEITELLNMKSMFFECIKLKSVDLSSFDTSKVTDMSFMFKDCDSLESIDLSNFNTASVEDLNSMFEYCFSLKSIDLSSFDLTLTTSTDFLFYSCSSLVSLDISKFTISNFYYADTITIFNRVGNLKYINIAQMEICSQEQKDENLCDITEEDISWSFDSDVKNLIVCQNGNFITSENTEGINIYDICCSFNAETGMCESDNYITLYFNQDTNYGSGFGNGYRNNIKFINYNNSTHIDSTALNILAGTKLEIHFTSPVTDMSKFFSKDEDSNMANVVSIDLSHFDSSSVENMEYLFYNCDALKILDLSNFNMQQVTNAGDMFTGLTSLIYLNASNMILSQGGVSGQFHIESEHLIVCQSQEIFRNNILYEICCSFNAETEMCESDNYISLIFNQDTNYESGFKNDNRNNIHFINYNAITYIDSSELNILAGTKLEIHFTSPVTSMEKFFAQENDSNMANVKSIDLSHFNFLSVENIASMFSGCNSLEDIDLSNIDTTKVINMSKMFSNCKSLKSIDLSKFATSLVTDMNAMFSGCSSLESIDLSKFDTTKVVNMANMFEGCQSLNSINLSNFITNKVENMNSMFSQCTKLKLLNLSNFVTSLVVSMDYMFYNCTSLNILDISNFNMVETTSAAQILTGLKDLSYINLYNTQDNNLISQSALNTDDNIEKQFYVCQKNSIITNTKSIPCCEYDINGDKCLNTLTTTFIASTVPITSIINITKEIEMLYNNIIENMEDQNYKIVQIEIGIFQFSTVEEQLNNKSETISSVDLGECEDKLRVQEGLNETEQFLIVKLDIINSTINATYVQYEIFNPRNYSKVNVDVCKNISIKISVPVILDDSKLSLISSLKDEGYNIFDINDVFYNDICATYTAQNGADMALSSRKTRIYDSIKDVHLCQEGCEFESFDTETSKANCNCQIQKTETVTDISKISFDKNEFFDSFYSTLFNSNFRVLKCIKLLFSIKGVKTNAGFYLMTGLLVCNISFTIVHILTGQMKLINIIKDIIKNKGIENGKNNNNNNIEEKEDSKDKVKNKGEKKIKVTKRKKHKKHSSKRLKKENIETKMEDPQGPPKKRSSQMPIERLNIYNPDNLVVETKDEINNKTEDAKRKTFIEKQVHKKKQNETIINEEQEKKILEEHKGLTDEELNDLDYEVAIICDKRTYWQLYWALLKKGQLIIFTFFINDDYNLRAIKILLFIVSFALYFSINAFFFTDDTMDKIYVDNGMFNFIFQLPQIIYSSLVSTVINMILQKLSISENQILDMKKEKDVEKAKKKANNIKNRLKLKLIIFIILSSVLMLFFWYFISCFCAAYKNTQSILIEDTLISFATSMIYPFGLKLLPGIFRIPSLRAPNKDQKYKYKISKILFIL